MANMMVQVFFRNPPIMLKIYLLCYAALLKNFAYYAQIMLTEIEQFPNIYSAILMHCLQIFTFISMWSMDCLINTIL